MDTNEPLDRVNAKRSILVVEDNEMNREMLCALLEDDFEVHEAENGLVGLEKLAELYHSLSLILLDAYMPECDGFEFLRRKRENAEYDTVPVIVATASDSTEDEIRCLELGANDFVIKPYNFDVMMNRITNIIRLRESASILNQLMWDNITGLYSKEFFFRELTEILAANPEQEYDMVCSDIERFGAVNDRYGEAQCNVLLHELAMAITDVLPGYVIGGRIGADVFAFVIEHQEDDWTDVLPPIAQRIRTASVNMKYGVKQNIDRSLAASATCDRALLAVETIKGHYGAHVAWFDESLHQQQVIEQQIIDNMESALERREFQVYFQPKHDLGSDKTGGAEALVRWISEDLGFVSPGQFIPLFERNGFVTQLDQFIWDDACAQVRRCMDQGLPVVPISINVSRLDFDLPNLADIITEMADRHGIDHSFIHVELTESAYADNPEIIENTLRQLRDNGFLVELDDFGSGFSSLASLNTLPLDVMKLDMSLIRQASKLDDFRVMQSIINLADTLGLRTVAEGVEDIAEVEKLKDMGCDYIQGYYYSKPLPQAEFEDYLRERG